MKGTKGSKSFTGASIARVVFITAATFALTTLYGLPPINRTAGELWFALTEIGFYFIVNHGVSFRQIREVFCQVARFHAQPGRATGAVPMGPARGATR